MHAKVKETPEMKLNPVIRVAKDGKVIYSNTVGEPILNTWGVGVGQTLPTYIGSIVQKVYSLGATEKMEIKSWGTIYLIVLYPNQDQGYTDILGFAIGEHEKDDNIYGKVFDLKLNELELRETTAKLQSQNEEVQMQNEELQAQSEELYEANEALKESERKYHLLFENMLDGFAYCKIFYDDSGHPVDFIYLDYNSAFERLTGLKGVKGKRVTELIPGIKELHPELFDIYGRVALTGQPERFEIDFKPLKIWLSISVYSTEKEHFVAVFDNIIERKKAEDTLKSANETLEDKVKERTKELEKAYNSLKESEERLAEAQKIAHIGGWERNLVTGELYWSNEMYSIFGRNPHEGAPNYNVLLDYIHPEDRDYMDKKIKRSLNGESYSTDHRIILDGGEERVVHVQADVVFDEKNIPVRIRGTVQDITGRNKAEEQIQNLANIMESSNDAIGTMSLDGIITNWNKEAEKIYGYSVKEILGKSISTLAPPHLDKETIKLIEKVKQGKKIQHYETKRIRKDGKIIYVSFTLSPVFNIHRKMTAISFISRDITERKEAEEALVNIEIARKQEIHHRIKNNLQVISSLLDLQADKFRDKEDIKDSEVLNAFKESQNRVISMALIHEELYKGGEIDMLNFSQYINELANNLFLTYRVGNDSIDLVTDIDKDILFDMDTAIPLGIIINELVSNSLKHAFPDRNEGEIQIKLHMEEIREYQTEGYKSKTFTLSISDNGIGIPKDLDIEDLDSLGLQLLTTLVKQLDGELDLKRDNGSEFIIKFTITEINRSVLATDAKKSGSNAGTKQLTLYRFH